MVEYKTCYWMEHGSEGAVWGVDLEASGAMNDFRSLQEGDQVEIQDSCGRTSQFIIDPDYESCWCPYFYMQYVDTLMRKPPQFFSSDFFKKLPSFAQRTLWQGLIAYVGLQAHSPTISIWSEDGSRIIWIGKVQSGRIPGRREDENYVPQTREQRNVEEEERAFWWSLQSVEIRLDLSWNRAWLPDGRYLAGQPVVGLKNDCFLPCHWTQSNFDSDRWGQFFDHDFGTRYENPPATLKFVSS